MRENGGATSRAKAARGRRLRARFDPAGGRFQARFGRRDGAAPGRMAEIAMDAKGAL